MTSLRRGKGRCAGKGPTPGWTVVRICKRNEVAPRSHENANMAIRLPPSCASNSQATVPPVSIRPPASTKCSPTKSIYGKGQPIPDTRRDGFACTRSLVEEPGKSRLLH